MVSPARWHSAQQYERGYWEALATRIADGSVSQLDWYKWRADPLILTLRSPGPAHLTGGGARAREGGGGPAGGVGVFPAAERAAVDPLQPHYASNPTPTAPRQP